MFNILVINPGSTSTKIAFYKNHEQVWKDSIAHPAEEIAKYPTVYDQLDMRTQLVISAFESHGEKIEDLSIVMSRGGLLPAYEDENGKVTRVSAGAYEVTPLLKETLFTRPVNNHASNLGCAIAYAIAQQAGVKAYIYDPVTVDELAEIVRVTGLKDIMRRGQGHNLNMRAAAKRVCQNHGVNYDEKNIIVAHLGGGCSVSLHHCGRIVELVSDDEGQMSAERAGLIPTYLLLEKMAKEKIEPMQMKEILSKKGGFISWFGTSDAIEIEKMITDGNQEAQLIYEHMALSVAQSIAKVACLVNGAVDYIVITGGIAYSAMFVDLIKKYCSFIGEFDIIPGENEMQALADGGMAILRGEEKAKIYGQE